MRNALGRLRGAVAIAWGKAFITTELKRIENDCMHMDPHSVHMLLMAADLTVIRRTGKNSAEILAA